jgi:hypothetical protein
MTVTAPDSSKVGKVLVRCARRRVDVERAPRTLDRAPRTFEYLRVAWEREVFEQRHWSGTDAGASMNYVRTCRVRTPERESRLASTAWDSMNRKEVRSYGPFEFFYPQSYVGQIRKRWICR